MAVEIREMLASDGNTVVAIYGQGIVTGHATFQEDSSDWQHWHEGHLPECRLVAVVDGAVVGWAGLSAVSNRCVYRGIAEVSIYIADKAKGQGVGKALMAALIAASETADIWTLQSSIFAENTASIKLHESYGFRIMGIREKIGKMTYGPMIGHWRDTTIMERRSKVVGID